MITSQLITAVLDNYPLSINGIHGISHWVRVRENGLRLAKQTGANELIIELFAIFHDSQRVSDWSDYDHGLRGAQFARTLYGSLFELSKKHFELLCIACEKHTLGTTHEDITVQTCFDADRLDLGRVGIMPDPNLLCTSVAKQEKTINWAYENSINDYTPDIKTITRTLTEKIHISAINLQS